MIVKTYSAQLPTVKQGRLVELADVNATHQFEQLAAQHELKVVCKDLCHAIYYVPFYRRFDEYHLCEVLRAVGGEAPESFLFVS